MKQAGVFMAHHNTREIKKCEARKGAKAQKFKNKAENLKKEMALLKVHTILSFFCLIVLPAMGLIL